MNRIMGYVVAVLLVASPVYAQSRDLAAQMMQNDLLQAKEPQETKPIVDSGRYASRPFIKEAYEAAKDYGSVFDKIYCYCHCAINPKFRHKSLLSCYTDDHAAACGICLRQGTMTKAMTDAGKTPRQIAEQFRSDYVKK